MCNISDSRRWYKSMQKSVLNSERRPKFSQTEACAHVITVLSCCPAQIMAYIDTVVQIRCVAHDHPTAEVVALHCNACWCVCTAMYTAIGNRIFQATKWLTSCLCEIVVVCAGSLWCTRKLISEAIKSNVRIAKWSYLQGGLRPLKVNSMAIIYQQARDFSTIRVSRARQVMRA